MQRKAPKYIAELAGVRELALHGGADLAWWQEKLAGEDLAPVPAEGRAQVIVTGLDARWLLWPFRDLSVAVVAQRRGSGETGLFFARAFNASRFIVFFERRWFKLPYTRAAVRVQLGETCSMRLGSADLLATRGPCDMTEVAGAGYTGALFLPGGRWLQVDIRGTTSRAPFDPARDHFEVAAAFVDPVFAGLRSSNFRGVCWHLRESAIHRRTKTFRRPR